MRLGPQKRVRLGSDFSKRVKAAGKQGLGE